MYTYIYTYIQDPLELILDNYATFWDNNSHIILQNIKFNLGNVSTNYFEYI